MLIDIGVIAKTADDLVQIPGDVILRLREVVAALFVRLASSKGLIRQFPLTSDQVARLAGGAGFAVAGLLAASSPAALSALGETQIAH